jgi:hypothetical protein
MEPTIIRIEIQSPLIDMPYNEGNAEFEINTNIILQQAVVTPETIAVLISKALKAHIEMIFTDHLNLNLIEMEVPNDR